MKRITLALVVIAVTACRDNSPSEEPKLMSDDFTTARSSTADLIRYESKMAAARTIKSFKEFVTTGVKEMDAYLVEKFGLDVMDAKKTMLGTPFFSGLQQMRDKYKFPNSGQAPAAKSQELDDVFDQLHSDLSEVSSDLNTIRRSDSYRKYIDRMNDILLKESKKMYEEIAAEAEVVDGEQVVSINDAAKQDIVSGIQAIEDQVAKDPSLSDEEKRDFIFTSSSITFSLDDIDSFFESLYPSVPSTNGRTQGFFKKLKHAFHSIVGAVIAVTMTGIGVGIGVVRGAAEGYGKGGVGGAIGGGIIGGALGFTIGVEMGFYFSCEYTPGLNTPKNCLECADGGFKGLTCQDCQAIFPAITC